MSIIRKILQRVGIVEPDFDAMPDMTGRGLNMQYWIDAMPINKEMPSPGDVVAKFDSDGMGATIRRDDRYRVINIREPYPTSFIAVGTDGKIQILHTAYLRRHTSIPRFWILMD